MPPSAPSTDFPGNVFFYTFLIGFLAFFLWSDDKTAERIYTAAGFRESRRFALMRKVL